MKSIKVKLYINHYQSIVLNTLSNEHRLLYNHLLSFVKIDFNFKQLNEQYKFFKSSNNLTIQSKPAQNTCRRLINSIKSFYKLHKKDKAYKFPYKFKSWKYFTTMEFDWNNGGGGFSLNDNVLEIFLEHNGKKFHKNLVIELPEYCNIITKDNVKTLQILKEDNNYFAIFTYKESKKEIIIKHEKIIAIDPGLSSILTIYNPVDNEAIEIKNNQFHKKISKQIEIIQSKRDKKKRGSIQHKKFAKLYKRVFKKLSNKNKDFQHKLSRQIVNLCVNKDVTKVIYGDIKTKNLVINDMNCKESKKENIEKNSRLKAKEHGLNKSTQNQGSLSRFKTFVEYKIKNEGIEFVKQNESFTTQINCLTNKLFDNKIKLSNRLVTLTKDLCISRDVNAAINIYVKNLGKPIVKGEWLAHIKMLKSYEMLLDIFSNELILNKVKIA